VAEAERGQAGIAFAIGAHFLSLDSAPRTKRKTWRGVRPQVGFTRLAHEIKPISGRPEIGVQIASFNFTNSLICAVASNNLMIKERG
jgi:hypothetical protein